MSEKIVVGPIDKGLRTNRTAFNIDNDNFPVLINAYQWRGRVKRKRGTATLNRLQRVIGTTDGTGAITVTILPTPILSGISLFTIGSNFFLDQGGASPLTLLTNGPGSAVLNRSTGVLTISGSIANTSLIYFPGLPVMGLEDFNISTNDYPDTIAFDTTYSYNVSTSAPYTPTDISFYKNPNTGTYSGYVTKTNLTPLNWNGQDYQQFWSTNYEGAFWATNGLSVPFTGQNIGMQFAPSANITYVSNTATTIVVNISENVLVEGDFVFFNEWGGTNAPNLNMQSGYVTLIAGAAITITLPNATLGSGPYPPGIIQFLTNNSNTALDCIRWYDGTGWVNFMPPLSQLSYSIAETPLAQYYLVGAKMIIPFKDRLLILGAVIQTSAANALPIYLPDTVVYSLDGTPYYTASFTGDPLNTATVFNSILVPANKSAVPYAWWEDQTGFGGFASAGIDQAITTASLNEDALIIGFNRNVQSRFIYSGNQYLPFSFFTINAELGSASTFSVINLDEGVMTRSQRGYIMTSQTQCARFDLDIPDQIFQISNNNNGSERVTAQRDFINEWIYFTYPNTDFTYKFPDQTLQYNYRDQSWGIFNESYTTYGQFQALTGFTWATIGNKFPTWASWTEPWSAGASTPLKPKVICGNQQGYMFFRDEGTGESPSLYIQNIVGNTVTSPNHCLNNNDYIVISGALGTVGSQVNGLIFSVSVPIGSTNTFNLLPPINSTQYLGGGQITRMYVPNIISKQFPSAWGLGRKTRIGMQQYLFTNTDFGQVSLNIYLSQDQSFPFNVSPIVPDPLSTNNSLVYSTVLYTCPESTNLGLTPANTNLQQLTLIGSDGRSANAQSQIWHRINTSLIGDTVQFGFTLNDIQMRDTNFNNQFVEIEFHSAILDISPSGFLS